MMDPEAQFRARLHHPEARHFVIAAEDLARFERGLAAGGG
jgi:hypothetical protein